MTTTFKHMFFGWLEAEARRWTNPDGSEGGIVATDATVHASVVVSGSATIGPRASIGYGASIGPRASIGDGASIGDEDWFTTVGPMGSRSAMSLAVYSPEHGLRWWVGCQHGISTDMLLARVNSTHGDNDHGQDYRAAIAYVEAHPGLARARAKAGAGSMDGGA